MKLNQKQNLIELTLHLLENEKDGFVTIRGKRFKFDMRSYIGGPTGEEIHYSGDHPFNCGTSCCALGDWMLLKDRSLTDAYQDLGVEYSGVWTELFSARHSNDVIQFAQRAFDVLHDHVVNAIFESKAIAIETFQELQKKYAKAKDSF